MGQVSGYTIPPCSKGLNVVDPIDNMDPSYARQLENWVPSAGSLKFRRGYTPHCTVAPATVFETLATLPLLTSTKLVAFSDSTIYDVTTSGASSIEGVTAITKGEVNTTVFANRLYACNGQDTPQVWTGTGNFADITFTGPTLANLINVSSYRERLYFVEKDTFKFWYGNTQAVGASALTSYDLQYFMRRGGKLLFAGSYTNQTAQTSQDLFFACSSEGELLFYTGSSPADTAWSLVARYVIGKPLGYRALFRVNGDVWILTQQGIVPLSALFATDPESALETVGAKVNPLITAAAQEVPFSHVWKGVFYPQGRKVYINIPATVGTMTGLPYNATSNYLLVYDIDAKAWTKYVLFSSTDCMDICVSDASIYWCSTESIIYKGENGYSDRGTQSITAKLKTAYNFLGSRNNFKVFKDIRPLLYGTPGVTINHGITTDFRDSTTLSPATIAGGGSTYTPWGSPWGSPWSTSVDYLYNRISTKGQGHSMSLQMQITAQANPLELFAIELGYEVGARV